MNEPSNSDTIDNERRVDSRFSCNICLEPVGEPVVTQCGHLYCWPCLFQWLEPGMTREEREALWGNQVFQSRHENNSRQCCPVCKAVCRLATLVPIYVRNEPTSHEVRLSNRSLDDMEREGDDVNEVFDLPADNIITMAPAVDERVPSSVPAVDYMPQDVETSAGLRQRLRFRSHDSNIPFDRGIPGRPAAMSPVQQVQQSRHRAQSYRGQNDGIVPHQSPHHASLSHGLAIAVQQALFQNHIDHTARSVPPLHRQAPSDLPDAIQREADRATEFLSRLLLMLGSFVILCLLLF
jgi:RING-type zinc-finger